MPLPISWLILIVSCFKIAGGQFVEIVVPLAGVEQIAGDHRVERDAAHFRPGRAEDDHVVFQILADFADGRVFQQRAAARRASAAGSSNCEPAGPRTGK